MNENTTHTTLFDIYEEERLKTRVSSSPVSNSNPALAPWLCKHQVDAIRQAAREYEQMSRCDTSLAGEPVIDKKDLSRRELLEQRKKIVRQFMQSKAEFRNEAKVDAMIAELDANKIPLPDERTLKRRETVICERPGTYAEARHNKKVWAKVVQALKRGLHERPNRKKRNPFPATSMSPR